MSTGDQPDSRKDQTARRNAVDPGPADPRRALGSRGEGLCEKELRRRGWAILERNWRIPMGELDIVAMDGSTLVILEVKSHGSSNQAGPETPVLAVGRQKQRRLRRLAAAWLATRHRHHGFEDLRFDVVGITFCPDGSLSDYEHIENAF
jgi:putative endonuclease